MEGCVGTWIKEMLIDKSNPFDIDMEFNDLEALESYFGKTCNLDSVLRGFGNNAEMRRFINKLRGLGNEFDIHKLLVKTLINFNNTNITSDTAFTLGMLTRNAIDKEGLFLLDDNLNEDSTILDLLSKISFNSDPDDHSWKASLGMSSKDKMYGLSVAEYVFGLRLFDKLPRDILLDAFDCKNSPVFKKYSYFFYREAIENLNYSLTSEDIDILLESELSIYDISPFSSIMGFEKYYDLFKVIAEKVNSGKITPNQARIVICSWNNFDETLQKAPPLRECQSFVACAALESLNKNAFNLNKLNFLNRSGNEKYELSVVNALELLPEELKEKAFLTYVAKYIDSDKIQSISVDRIIDNYLNNRQSQYLELWKDLKNLKESVATLSLSSVSEITLAYWLSRSTIPSKPIYEFIPVDSDDWWDYGSKTLPNIIKIHSPDSIVNEVNDSDFNYLSKIALKNEFHRLLVENSERLCLSSHSYWSLGEVDDMYLNSVKSMSETELTTLSENLKYAALLFILPRDVELAKKIVNHLPESIRTMSNYESDHSSNAPRNKAVLIRNLENINHALNKENICLQNPEESNIFDIFADIIGVQKREVSHGTMLCSIAIDKCINAGIIESSKKVTSVTLSEDEKALPYDYDYDRRYSINSFIRSHFPRLKAEYSFLQIEAIYNYLSSKDELHKYAIENFSREGVFQKDDALYVFGEFDWSSILNLVNSDIESEFKKIIILTSRVIEDEDEDEDEYFHDECNFEVEETTFLLTSDIINIILFVRNALDFEVSKEFLTEMIENPYQKACSRILPEINYEGILLNKDLSQRLER
ncbi:hypothetical protein AKG60_03185 [Vibrio parahaemolyticus]|uniref:Uncharacterized protein n=1 Tax=Vibrio parahaemolyticus TaxID=670 RepID=A0AAX0MGX6_VIBPH|nr:hypothetical protein [Vibrio parahaemolyticus]KOF25485.1 hypothetical protein ACX13_22065 [Vibrio parahaemolyticus]MCS0331080.1 hypothetical protein [Vibrio diabolicus]MCS0409826.1 hypothetical protein [Vibrio diabolicus]OQK03904.1 hypothetical protein AKG60_03185 [Vibrio parahaemolyticus]